MKGWLEEKGSVVVGTMPKQRSNTKPTALTKNADMKNERIIKRRLESQGNQRGSVKLNQMCGTNYQAFCRMVSLVVLTLWLYGSCADGMQPTETQWKSSTLTRSTKMRDCQQLLIGIDSGGLQRTSGVPPLSARDCKQTTKRRRETTQWLHCILYLNQGIELNPAQQVNRYIEGVQSGDIVVGRRVRQCVERHLHDLEHASNRGYYFDESKASAAIAWFPIALKHVEGEWAGKSVELTDNQAFIVWCIMGWRRADGTRRFRHAYISCGRKWGKSTLAAGLALLLLTFDDPLEPGAQVYCAATKEDQAKIVHNLAKHMAEASPILIHQVGILAKSIVSGANSLQPKSFFKPLGSDSRTADGFNLHAAVIDEVHEWMERHRGLWDKLNTASGSRRQPLIVTITTAGDDKSQLWIEIEDLCVATLDRFDEDDPPGDNRFVFIARLDEKRACDCGGLDACRSCDGSGEIPEDDPFDEKNWAKANPNYPITPKPDFLREQASDAKNSPAVLHAFKRYHMNIRVSSLEQAIEETVWMRARSEFLDWEDADAICGAWDMGGQDDLAAIGLCARFETGEYEIDSKTGKPDKRNPIYRYEVDAKAFLNTSAERDVTQGMWPDWIRQGLVVVHAREIEEMKADIVREFRDNLIRSWAYDPANSRDFAQSLEPEGIETVKFWQNAGMWTEPITNFLRDLKRGRIHHDGNGLLTWAVKNLIIVNASKASSVQVMPDKRNSPDKIDPIVSVIMAYRLASIAPRRSRGKLFVC